MLERAVFRAASRALRRSRSRLPQAPNAWGESLRGAAAASQFIAEETLEDAEAFLDLELALTRHRGAASTLARSWLRDGGAVDLPAPLRRAIRDEGGGDAVDHGLALIRLCGDYGRVLDALKKEGLVDPPEPKARPEGLLFCVGDVLAHRFFGRCVVVGWAETCPMGDEWIAGNRIRENLVNGPDQPFYSVLLEENHVPRCVSEENVALEADPSAAAFDHFAMPYYFADVAPRAALSGELRFAYPEDDAARAGDRDYRTLDEAHAPPYFTEEKAA